MTPRQLYDSFAPKDGNPNASRMGRVPFTDLPGILAHHTARSGSVSTEHFGLVDLPLSKIVYRLLDPYTLQKAARTLEQVREKHPEAADLRVEVSISVHRLDRVKHEAYDFHIFSIGVWYDGFVWDVP